MIEKKPKPPKMFRVNSYLNEYQRSFMEKERRRTKRSFCDIFRHILDDYIQKNYVKEESDGT